MTIDLISQSPSTNSALPWAKRDVIFEGTEGGVWGFDMASRASFPRQAAPINGDPIRDLEIPAFARGDGQIAIPASGGTLGWSNNMLQFTNITKRGAGVCGPDDVMGDIYGRHGSGATATCTLSGGVVNAVTITNGGSGYINGLARVAFTGAGQTFPIIVTPTVVGGVITSIPLPSVSWSATPTITVLPSPQNYLACAYIRLPTEANWVDSTAPNEGLLAMGAGALDPAVSALFDFGQTNDGRLRYYASVISLAASRQLNITPASGDFDKVCQIGMWRQNNAMYLSLRRLAAGSAPTVVSGASEPYLTDFSSHEPTWGIAGARPYTGTWSADYSKGARFGVARGWIESLDVTGRDPVTQLQRDWEITLARGVYA